MRVGKAIVIAGIVILMSGIIFHLQGQGVVGPESSFMYTNPEWTIYGLEIFVIGIVILGIGLWLMISKKIKL